MNCRSVYYLTIFLTILAMASCKRFNNPVASCKKAPDIFVKELTQGGANVEIEIRIKSGLISTPPSFAVWAEYKDGTEESIYVTCKASLGYDDNPDSQTEALPVWNGVRTGEGLEPGDKELDAITTATPMRAGFIIHWEAVPAQPGDTIQLFLEVNMPYDYNDFFSPNLGTNGQPSVIWATSFVMDQDSLSVIWPGRIIGRSDPRGRSTSLFPDRNGITTALTIIEGFAARGI